MSSTTVLTVKVDKELKETARETARKLGLPLGTAVNAFLKQFVRDQEITLSVSYVAKPYLRKIIMEAEKDYAKGDVHNYNSMEEFLKSF